LIPHLPVRVEWRRDPTLAKAPLIVGGRRWDEGAVLDCCPRATSAGVEPGMRLTQAETLCPEARFLPADEEAYSAVHRALIDNARRFTPTVEAAELGLVYADISGLKRRFDDADEATRRLIKETFDSAALDVQIGAASGKFVARQAARAARPGEMSVVSSGEERAFLSPLDISVLPLDPEMERRLRLLGVRTLGAFAKLPRPAVLRQFGSSAGTAYDLACGTDARPVHADAPPLRLTRSHTFLDPVSDRRPLLAHIERMADELAGEIDRRGYQAEGLLLEIEDLHGDRHTAGKPVKPPSSSADQLSRLGARMLGGLTTSGPVTGLTLTLFPLRPFHRGATQLAFFGPADPAAASPLASPATLRVRAFRVSHTLRETLRRLRDRFGDLVILVASLVVAPSPSPTQVTTDHEGLPRGILWRGRIWEVRSIYEHWRERRRWWGPHPIERDYFRLEVESGTTRSPARMKVIFRDVRTNRWYTERRHI
jgi:DNA polymerase-4